MFVTIRQSMASHIFKFQRRISSNFEIFSVFKLGGTSLAKRSYLSVFKRLDCTTAMWACSADGRARSVGSGKVGGSSPPRSTTPILWSDCSFVFVQMGASNSVKECRPARAEVAGSNPASRSTVKNGGQKVF